MKKLSNSEIELKKDVAYKKSVYLINFLDMCSSAVYIWYELA